MNRCSFCEWIPILPWPVWPLAGHARLGQNTVVGSMTILLSWLCWGACQEEVCLDPRFLCNLTLPRFSVELPLNDVRVERHTRRPSLAWGEARPLSGVVLCHGPLPQGTPQVRKHSREDFLLQKY